MGLARFDAGSVGFALTTALTITVYTLIDGRGAFGHDGDTDCGSSPRCAKRACSLLRSLAWPARARASAHRCGAVRPGMARMRAGLGPPGEDARGVVPSRANEAPL